MAPIPLSDQQMQFCSYIEQVYLLHSELPSFEVIQNALQLDRNTVIRLWNNKECKKYLEVKGITFETNTNRTVLNPLQLLAINVILDFRDTRSDTRKLKELGVTTSQFQKWKADPAFQNYIAARVDKIVGTETDEIDRSLFDAARNGDLQAIRYINEFTGRFVSRDGSSSSLIDTQAILIKITEILQRHLAVEYPTVLEAIGRELQSLSYANSRPTPSPPVGVIKGELL